MKPRARTAAAAAVVPVIATLLFAVAPAAARTPSVVAGATARPDTAFLANVRPCTHHVTTTGSDTNPGTAAAPWRTIRKALLTLTAGQTACVHAGTYPEGANAVTRAGTPSAPIAVVGAPGEPRPVVTSTATGAPFDFQPGAAYWLLDGIVVDKAGRDGNAVRVISTHHVVVRNSYLGNGSGPGIVGVYNDSSDVAVMDSELANQHRWVNGSGTVAYTRPDGTYLRADANGVVVERGPDRVLVVRNHIHDNGGDGVACLRGADELPLTTAPSEVPTDLTIEDNRITANSENAVDIKSCDRVSIRGSVSPDRAGPAAASTFSTYRPTIETDDQPRNEANGEAVVLHWYARRILIENQRISDSCEAVAIGRHDVNGVTDVVIRRTLIYSIVGPSTDEDCRGNGIRATLVQRMDVVHNTIDGVPGSAIMLASDNEGTMLSSQIGVWNNIIRTTGADGYWLDVHRQRLTGFESDRNLVWHPDGSPDHMKLDFARTSLPTWRTQTGQDLTSRRAAPLFTTDPATNEYYFTQASSQARDSALVFSGARWCGAGPDIGFRESGC